MTLPIYQDHVTNDYGDIQTSATFRVKLESTGLDAVIYSDRAGTTQKTGGPNYPTDNGLISFFAPAGEYIIEATSAAGTYIKRYEVLTGTAATLDTGTAANQIPTNADLYVDSIADLPPVVVGQQIDVASYYYDGNIGGGRLLGVSAARHNGGTVFDPARYNEIGTSAYFVDSGIDAPCYIRLNIEYVTPFYFGARANGTSDKIFIQAAIDSDYDVNFLENFEYIVDSIRWSKSARRYYGKSRLKLTDGTTTNISAISNNITDLIFEGLEFDGNGSQQSAGTEVSNGVTLPFVTERIKFYDCYFHDFGPATNTPPNPVGNNYNYGDGIVQGSNSATNNSYIIVENCRFENCYAGAAFRGTNENIRVLNCDFKHCTDNSVKTRQGATNVIIEGCHDEDTRGCEAWGQYLRYVDNYSLNSHRHGISGGVRKSYISGNSFVHTTPSLGSLYAIEVGLSDEVRVTGNYIKNWDGQSAIRLTDSAQASANSVISANVVIGGVFGDSAIGTANAQDNCVYSNNIIIDCEGDALAPRGSNLIIDGNLVKDTTGDLTSAKVTSCLRISVGSQQTITNNSFSLAGPWQTGDSFYTVINASLNNSIVSGNYLYGGRNTFSGGIENGIIAHNRIDSVEKIINSDSGSQGGIYRDNIATNFTSLLDTGVYDGFSYLTLKIGQGTAAPATGTWGAGDKILNTALTVDANNMILYGWLCVSGGAPGTWQPLYISTVSPAT